MSFLKEQYASQVTKEKELCDPTLETSAVSMIIDPRFNALLNRATVLTRSNQISPEVTSYNNPSNENITILPVTKSEKANCKPLLSPVCKNRFQGVLVGLLLAGSCVGIALAVILTRSSSTSITYIPSPCNTLKWNPIGTTLFGNGTAGNSSSQLSGPLGIFIDLNDNVYVADTNNHRVLNISSLGIATIVAGITNVPGTSSNTLRFPSSIYVDSQKNLYIVDKNNFRVQFWPYGASNGSTVAGSPTGVSGSTLDKFGLCFGLYVDKASNIYISDYWYHRVIQWPSGASIGVLIAGNGSAGSSSSQLNSPIGLTMDPTSSTLYIADFTAQTIIAWPSSSTTGTIVAGSYSTAGSLPSSLNQPWGIIRDTYGNLYVSDEGNHRIQMFCANGSSFSSGTTIAGVGAGHLSSQALFYPTAIAFDSQMNLYVCDYGNNRIQKFLRTN